MTTSFNSALQTSDYNALRGVGGVPSYAGAQYASQCPNRVVFAAQFNSAQSGNSWAQEEWHNATVGAYTDALPGQLFFASKSNDMSEAYFVGRVRKAFGATTTYFNETSISQAGNDYFWVLDTYPVMDKLLRFLLGQQAYKADYDLDYRPLRPIIGSANDAIGCKSAYAGFVDPANSNKFRISLSILIYPSESAATITSWSLNYLDGTLHSGSASGSGATTGTITLDFPAGFRNILFTATNSAGQSTTLAIAVWAETRSGSPTLITGFAGSQITLDASSPTSKQTCSIDVFTTELQNTLDNTLICIWDEEYLQGSLGSIGGNVRFLGRLRKEQNVAQPDEKYLRTLVTKYTLEGPDTQLDRLDALKFGMKDNTSPTTWGDVKSFNPYRAIALLLTEFTTFTNAHVMSFDNFDDTFPYPAINTVGSTMLGVLNDIGMSINAQMQFAPDGRASFVRRACYLTSNAQRNALTTVANWGDLDRTPGLNISFDEIRNLAQVDAWGGEDIGTQQVVPLHSQAPGLARDIGDKGQDQLLKQILSNVGVADAQIELNDRAGCAWLFKALQRYLSNITHPPAYGFLIPDTAAWYTWTISASDNLRGISYDTSTRWLLTKIAYAHNNVTGEKTVTPTYLLETNGIGYGNTIAIITSNTLPPDQQAFALGTFALTQPIVPPIELSGPDSATLKSGISKLALILSDGTITYTTNFNQTPPTWTTPTSLGVSGTVLQWVPDFHSGYYAGGGAGSKSYGWIVTTTGVYYGDINTPSFSLGHSFRATSSLRSASASLVQAGHIVVITDYSDGTYATYATTGANWTSEASVGAGNGTLPPGCWYSQHTALLVYASINGTGKMSTDGGATWSTFGTISPGSDCAVDITVPYPGNPTDALVYYVKNGSSVTTTYDFSLGDQGFVATFDNTVTPPTLANYASGTWNSIVETGDSGATYHNFLEFYKMFTAETVTSITVTFDRTTGSFSSGGSATFTIVGLLLGSTVFTQTHTPGATGTDVTETWTGSGLVDEILIAGEQAHNPSSTPGGSLAIKKVVVVSSVSGARALMQNSSDVSPLPGYAPWKSLPQMSVALSNASIVGVAAGNNDESLAGLFVTTNAGSLWTTLVAPVADGTDGRYDWLPMSGNATPVLYPAGSKGRIGYSATLTGPIVDKRGNLSTAASVVGLAGYRS